MVDDDTSTSNWAGLRVRVKNDQRAIMQRRSVMRKKTSFTYEVNLFYRLPLRASLSRYGHMGETYWSNPSPSEGMMVYLLYNQMLEPSGYFSRLYMCIFCLLVASLGSLGLKIPYR